MNRSTLLAMPPIPVVNRSARRTLARAVVPVLCALPYGCTAARDAAVPAQLLTRPEATDYQETSLHADVMAMLSALQAAGAPMDVQYIGKSSSGKQIPLVIAADPPVAGAVQARRTGKLVVYVQANIHAGEVEGKEAALILLRKLQAGHYRHWLKRMVLLVTPIYNADGNDRLADGARIRPSQNGPARVGQRASGEGMDLNRDCMKAAAIETRAVLRHVYNAWDPDVVMDLHTTNGTRHGYQLTYSPPLNPNTDAAILAFARDELLPTVRRRMRRTAGMELFDYGNVDRRPGGPVWASFGEEGRYVSNYVGLRNRIGILSEAASFQPFKTRVDATLHFVEHVLDEVASQATRVAKLTRAADERLCAWGRDPNSAPLRGVRFDLTSRGVEHVPLEKALPDEEVNHRTAPTQLELISMPILDRFAATRSTRWPAAYIVPAEQKATLDLLRRHGVIVEELVGAWTGMTEQFTIDEMESSISPFSGGRLIRLEGRYKPIAATVTAGTCIVRTAQPLGLLAFHLLEPECLDGAPAWGFVQGTLTAGSVYPISRTTEQVKAATIRLGTAAR